MEIFEECWRQVAGDLEAPVDEKKFYRLLRELKERGLHVNSLERGFWIMKGLEHIVTTKNKLWL